MIFKKKKHFDKAYDLFLTSSVKSNKAGIFPLANSELAISLIRKGNLPLARDILREQLSHPLKIPVRLNHSRKLLDYVEKELKK